MPLLNQHVLKQLRYLVVTNDPPYMGMKKLKIGGRELSATPKEVFHMIELEVLDLSPERETCLFHQLRSIPPGIGNLVNLRILMLDTNDVIELPREISMLSNLEKLSLSNNLLSTLPIEFEKLQRLSSLHVANNQFETFPSVVLSLKSLEFLDLSDNRIIDVPNDIGSLKKLQTLLLFMNNIKALPNGFCKLKNLRTVWLGMNSLTELPREFGSLVNLDWNEDCVSATIDGNPLTKPPMSVCKMGPYAIKRFFDMNENTAP
ncbi:unnamed protein product [Owenia fusiformis]|uniref:Disease resistance R13L4/SHOC-2-like LRR domain-containing protein n=1 Tax=Owenia fusiformis TaxID=6347 RepID=A0A8J1XM39_OWEFU|nr:unnamed protein product [Owenia fusiformis]